MIYFLNGSILTDYGFYEFRPLSEQEAREFIRHHLGIVSAIGHSTTAEFVSEKLGVAVATARITVKMEKGDEALIFQLKIRPPEGVILSREELEKTPYQWGILKRTN